MVARLRDVAGQNEAPDQHVASRGLGENAVAHPTPNHGRVVEGSWAGLLARGSPLPHAFPPCGSGTLRGRSPLTVAGPRRIHTGFPILPMVRRRLLWPGAPRADSCFRRNCRRPGGRRQAELIPNPHLTCRTDTILRTLPRPRLGLVEPNAVSTSGPARGATAGAPARERRPPPAGSPPPDGGRGRGRAPGRRRLGPGLSPGARRRR